MADLILTAVLRARDVVVRWIPTYYTVKVKHPRQECPLVVGPQVLGNYEAVGLEKWWNPRTRIWRMDCTAPSKPIQHAVAAFGA